MTCRADSVSSQPSVLPLPWFSERQQLENRLVPDSNTAPGRAAVQTPRAPGKRDERRRRFPLVVLAAAHLGWRATLTGSPSNLLHPSPPYLITLPGTFCSFQSLDLSLGSFSPEHSSFFPPLHPSILQIQAPPPKLLLDPPTPNVAFAHEHTASVPFEPWVTAPSFGPG